MDSENNLRQMEDFDFSKPYGVSITFEDNDDDATFKNVLKERENKFDHSNNKEVPDIKCKSGSLSDKSSEKLNEHKDLNKSVSSDKISKIHKKKIALRKIRKTVINETMNNEKIEINMNQNVAELQLNQNGSASSLNSDIRENNEKSVPIIHNEMNNHEPITTFVEDLLNRLSDHLIIIIKAFYHYGSKKKTCDPLAEQDSHKREKVFTLIKSHFFELSYTTMETIILPQAQNDNFINQFLDNTVLLANSKSLKWKCQKRLVKLFFDELLEWTKKKQDYMKTNPQDPSNNNIMLKQHLIRPLQPFNHAKSASNMNYTPTLNTQNNVCIFSSGPPGNEISININPDTLINCNQRQYTNTVEWTKNQNDYAPRVESVARNTSFVLPSHEKHVNDVQKNNTNYYYPPPPYNVNRNSMNVITKPNYTNQKNVNPIQNNHNFRPPHQNHQNTRQQIQKHRTQVQYVNVNQSSPPNTDYLKSLVHDARNNQTHGSLVEKRFTPSTLLAHPMACMNVTVRCCMCGKVTGTMYVPYNQPCRPFYCSYLCQELDSQFYKATGGTSNT